MTKAQRWLTQQIEQPRITVGGTGELESRVEVSLERDGHLLLSAGSPYGGRGHARLSQEHALKLADWLIENFR